MKVDECKCGEEAALVSPYPHAEGVGACVKCFVEIGEEATVLFLKKCKTHHWEDGKWKKGAAIKSK
jgi:hypothetical protein